MFAQTVRMIAAHGQTVAIKRGTGAYSIPFRAFVRGYQPDELAGDIKQGDRMAVIAGNAPLPFPEPVKGDTMLIAGKTISVIFSEAVRDGDAVVRFNLSIRG